MQVIPTTLLQPMEGYGLTRSLPSQTVDKILNTAKEIPSGGARYYIVIGGV